jgi:hypothetical protein
MACSISDSVDDPGYNIIRRAIVYPSSGRGNPSSPRDCLIFLEVGEDIVVDEPSNKIELRQGGFDGTAVDGYRNLFPSAENIESIFSKRSEV